MYKDKIILAIIPARSGSKRIPHKNIKPLNKKPLIAYTIEVAKKSKYLDRIIVSTDSAEITKVAKKYKAEVPFQRPAYLAKGNVETGKVAKHAVKYLQKKEKFLPDLVVLLQPNSPFLEANDIDKAIEMLCGENNISCFSATPISERPEWMFFKKNNQAKPFIKSPLSLKPSHILPELFLVSGAVYVVETDYLLKQEKITSLENSSILVIPRERSIDIDTPFDFDLAQFLLKEKQANKKLANKK